MKYKKIRVSYDTEVTGNVNGVYSVEIKIVFPLKVKKIKNISKAFF